MRRFVLTITALVMASVVTQVGTAGAAVPPIKTVPVLSGLVNPVLVRAAKDGTNRLFVVEQGGTIRVAPNGSSTSTQFLDITSRVLSGGEQGLLGLTFHPNYATNGRFFVNYTRQPDGATVVSEFHVSSNPNVGDATSEHVLFTIAQPYANHNGGMIEFGPDGLMYIGMGDGGSANDPGNRAQNPNSLLGKMLRINVDAVTPAPSIYALGLRNPWRFSFDRLNGRLLAGDVGQSAREEIDIITPGANFGWRVFEGTMCTNNDPAACLNQNKYTAPIADYAHSNGRCAVTGGYAYRGTMHTMVAGTYVFGDFCTGEVFVLDKGKVVVALKTSMQIASFGEDEAGELYVVEHRGSVHRIARRTVKPCTLPPPLCLKK